MTKGMVTKVSSLPKVNTKGVENKVVRLLVEYHCPDEFSCPGNFIPCFKTTRKMKRELKNRKDMKRL